MKLPLTSYLGIMAILILLAPGIKAQQKDSLFLRNGQVLVGAVKGIELGVLTIDETDLKIIKIKVYKIKYIIAQSDNFRIETIKKATYFSQLHRSPSEGSVILFENEKAKKIDLLEITTMVPLQKGFLKRLDGNLSIGFSYTKSSSIGQLSSSANVFYAAKKFEYQLSISSIASIDSSKYSRDNESFQVFTNYNFTETWFLAAQLYYQRNLELSISRRYQELIGAGNKLIMHNDLQLMGVTGLNLAQEKSTEGTETFQVEIPLLLRFNFFKYQRYNIKITANQAGYISLTQAGRFRYDGNVNYSQEIIHNFYITWYLYTNYDSRPPDQAINNFDYGTTLSITYQF